MQLLTRVYHLEEVQRIISLLQTNGIPAFGQTASFRLPIPHRIWVCVDSQVEDARSLLRDPNHIVCEPLDVAQYDLQFEAFDHSKLLRDTLRVLVVVAVLMGGVFFVVYKFW